MSENYIVINGKKAELTQEQLEALGIEPVVKKDPFAVQCFGERYCFIDSCGCINAETEDHRRLDNMRFDCANYCADEDLLMQQAYRETLNRLLWRFSMEHDGDQIDWHIRVERKWKIKFYNKKWVAEWNSEDHILGCVYFYSKKIAEQAIEEIVKPFMASHPDFKL